MTLGDLFSNAYRQGCESTIGEMAVLFEMPLGDHPFELCLAVAEKLGGLGLVMVPALPKGDLSSPRLVCAPARIQTIEEALAELQQGEGPTVEFKSTFMFDVERSKHDKNVALADLKSEAVMHGCLKTVAAFLNTSGGCLFVGVTDDGDVCGVERDFGFLAKKNVDDWELCFRQCLQGRFHDGVTVNNFVRVAFVGHDSGCVARVEVSPRTKISYLKHPKINNAFEVFVRQGNQTVSLNHLEFEQLLESRR